MILKSKIKSKIDSTVKYVFKNDNDYTVEFSYINKNDGKDIICVPCQTMCNLGCKFCHCTEYIGKIKSACLCKEDIIEGIYYILGDLNLHNSDKTLLISFMGIGEPMFNYIQICDTMYHLTTSSFKTSRKNVRFAVATSLPKHSWPDFFRFTTLVEERELNVKLHLSLHYTNDEQRKEWMPHALGIQQSILACRFYNSITGNPVEIHYALIEGINDNIMDATKLGRLLQHSKFNVKFLLFNEKKSLDFHASSDRKTLRMFRQCMEDYFIASEYYIPPGLDIGASCGQFLMEEYL